MEFDEYVITIAIIPPPNYKFSKWRGCDLFTFIFSVQTYLEELYICLFNVFVDGTAEQGNRGKYCLLYTID